MHRIDGPGATAESLFTEGDADKDIPVTTVTGDWLNAIQEEIAGVIVGAGIALSKRDNGQLAAAITALMASCTLVSAVGGILRDVFTMGARPIACLNALSFGDPEHPKTRHLVSGVVAVENPRRRHRTHQDLRHRPDADLSARYGRPHEIGRASCRERVSSPV